MENTNANAYDRAHPKFGAELNIESIINAPLVAVSKANVTMLTGQVRFLLDYCFVNEHKMYKPVMITMTLSKGVVNYGKQPADAGYIQVTEMAFQMPLLCLLPLNTLAIEKVKVDFDLEITSIGSYKSTRKKDAHIVARKAVLNGRVAPQPPRTSKASAPHQAHSHSHLKVSVNAGALPLSKGLLTVIDLYTKAIQPLPQQEAADSNDKL
ncbi:MAG: DUF2589 domain-containing protein [Prevotellaceae bacterium]|jgi:hypothetical protein|nr:DUF2589 domain-containing protein [Prevotellaceae bacterium]